MVFTVFAIGFSLWISLHQWDLFSSPVYVGLSNFVRLLTNDRDFKRALLNTLYFAVGIVPLGTAASLCLALLANRALKGMTFFRTVMYLPSVSSTIAVGIVWIWLLDPQFGVVNYALRSIGVANPPNWLGSIVWAKPALILMHIWQYAGYYMIIFLAGLQGIPEQLYEAAVLDGASSWQKFWRITLPLLSPTTFFVVVMKMIGVFNIFEQPFIMTGGGPSGSTETIVYYIYSNAFEWFNMGYASAVAWVLFILVFGVTLIQFKYQGRWVNYE
ncbi:MAG TPA: sugar ABC transporter permease [Firmicutes bacterium]|nr:sugar ABC transporter permease [Bacillota bacterium]